MTALRFRPAIALVILGLFLSPAALPQASAAPPASPIAVAIPASSAGKYWQGFTDFWKGAFKRQNGIVMIALGVGALSLFIITRNKWRKW